MRFSNVLPACFLAHLLASNPETATENGPPPNANHIFNAIHSSMRQWGSSLNHNGMSFFLATVPKGTEFYHGTHVSEPVIGMEWLAFEPEHALLFARGRGPPVGRPGHPPRKPGSPRPPKGGAENGPPPRSQPQHKTTWGQSRLESEQEMISGWLHTYSAKSDLRLLYLDGMSAGKTDMGTLDSQDIVLLNETGQHPGFWEYERAKGMCQLASEEWNGRIDGFLRMEAGFEIILCSFLENLDTVRITAAKAREDRPELAQNNENAFAYYRAVSARYDGIGGGRVRLNYDDFISVYSYPLDLFQTGNMPRLQNISTESAARILTDLDKLIMSDEPVGSSQDWQTIADMIINRYATSLKYLASDSLQTIELLRGELERVLRPFIDYDDRNTTTEITRCTTHFLPTNPQKSLAGRVIMSVSDRICSALHTAMTEDDYSTAKSSIYDLIKYLDWTEWKRCQGCAYNEICFIPMWPKGSLEDRLHPSCLNATELSSRNGYWGPRN